MGKNRLIVKLAKLKKRKINADEYFLGMGLCGLSNLSQLYICYNTHRFIYKAVALKRPLCYGTLSCSTHRKYSSVSIFAT